jgi:cell wall-associated NlpC family hydrolase
MNGDGRNLGPELARLAAEWAALEVPYVHRGTSRSGCDCTGLVIGIAREMGYLGNYELRDYPPDWNLHAGAGNQIIAELDRVAEPVAGRPLPGDIAVMHFGRCPAHVGILVSRDLMVHSHRDARRCLYAKMQNSPWSKRWRCTYRLDREKLIALDG